MEQKKYVYYSTQRPVDIGTYPKPPDNPMTSFHNFDERRPVEDGARLAWGVLTYEKPLTDREMHDYELRPSRDNPDVRERMCRQAQELGPWEVYYHVPEEKRLTEYDPADRRFHPCAGVTPERMIARLNTAQAVPIPQKRPGKTKHAPRHGER